MRHFETKKQAKEIVAELSKICPVWVTDIITIQDNFKMISDFGQLLNCRTEAQKWNDKLAFALSDFQNFVKDKPFKKAAYFIWKNPFMVAGPSLSTGISTSNQLFIDIANGQYPALMALNWGFVDVREVAEAHVRA